MISNYINVIPMIVSCAIGFTIMFCIRFPDPSERLMDEEIDAACLARFPHFKNLAPMYQDEIREDAIKWYRAWTADETVEESRRSHRKERRSQATREFAIRQFRMDELDAVMLSVDKWLDGDALKNNPATRAGDAREIALKAIEKEVARADRVEKELASMTFIPSGREHEIACSFASCNWGQGLDGTGRCSGHGNPRDPHCPKFTDGAVDYKPEAEVGKL